MRFILGTASAVAILAAATPAAAAPLFTATAQAEARGTILSSQSLTKDRDLDFGVITTKTTGAGGTVSVSATDLSVQTITAAAGDITPLGGTVSSARFYGFGNANQPVSLSMSPVSQLTGPNGVIPASLTLSTVTSTDGSGKFTAWVGGTFTIAANQAPGLYTTAFNVTADFN